MEFNTNRSCNTPLISFSLSLYNCRTPRCTSSTQKVSRPRSDPRLRGKGPVSWWGTWKTSSRRLRPRPWATAKRRTETWWPRTQESGESLGLVTTSNWSGAKMQNFPYLKVRIYCLLVFSFGIRDEAREEIFKKGQSKRIWGELYKVCFPC